MVAGALEQLVLDTLYFNRTNSGNTCLVTNVAGQELQEHSEPALSVIERVVDEVVRPVFSAAYEELYEEVPGLPGVYCHHPFNGLDDLLGAYLLIGSKYDVARVIRFLRTLPTALQAEAVAVVPVFFGKRKIPDKELVSFISELLDSKDPVLREKAERAITFLQTP